jgi:hypothetical protein
MICEEDVDLRLKRWARHVSGSLRGGFLGLPGRCTYLEMAIKSTARTDREVPEEVWETDRAVRDLDLVDKNLRTAIEVSYLEAGDRPSQARMMQVSKSTRARLVDRAIQQLIVILNERKK